MTSADYKEQFKRLKCCVLIPTFNNAGAIGKVISGVLEYSDEVCVVNDGSTDNTLEILSRFPQIKLHSYSKNQGKGYALQMGFELARKSGYDFAITIDSDGQHFPDDLPTLLAALEQHKNAIIVGARNMEQAGAPGKSSFGNKFSNFWFTLETGIKIPDTQSGFRLYPIRLLEPLHFLTKKYEFEVEVLVRAAWNGIEVLAIPVKVYYPPAEERVTHFRPFMDFTRISLLNSVLVIRAFLWIKPRDFFRSLAKKPWRTILDEYLIRSHETPHTKAFSVALGVFFGISPFWGLQMWLVIFFAWLFKLNKGVSVLASNISIPPMIPLILFLSYETGALWLGNKAVHLAYSEGLTPEVINKNLFQYVLGSFTLAAFCSVIAGFSAYVFVKRLKAVPR